MAVLKVMDMNTMLYRHLFSTIFDVPEYEKKNILYNSQVRELCSFSMFRLLLFCYDDQVSSSVEVGRNT